MDKSDREPVFLRSRWETNRYVYNPHNPIGCALIVISLLFAIGAMYGLSRSHSPDVPGPSGGEHTAVRSD
ncbi:hypothetical protein [Streptomyces smyrnaeus]|uniref:hypothetical protein n=1 Tax=Streptomyces smyrnaeus TaxID=1387713 RepID=UPI0036B560E5